MDGRNTMQEQYDNSNATRPEGLFNRFRRSGSGMQKSLWISLAISLGLTLLFKNAFFLFFFPIYPLQQFWKNLRSNIK